MVSLSAIIFLQSLQKPTPAMLLVEEYKMLTAQILSEVLTSYRSCPFSAIPGMLRSDAGLGRERTPLQLGSSGDTTLIVATSNEGEERSNHCVEWSRYLVSSSSMFPFASPSTLGFLFGECDQKTLPPPLPWPFLPRRTGLLYTQCVTLLQGWMEGESMWKLVQSISEMV